MTVQHYSKRKPSSSVLHALQCRPMFQSSAKAFALVTAQTFRSGYLSTGPKLGRSGNLPDRRGFTHDWTLGWTASFFSSSLASSSPLPLTLIGLAIKFPW